MTCRIIGCTNQESPANPFANGVCLECRRAHGWYIEGETVIAR